MDKARALTIAGIALAVAALLGLFLTLTADDDGPGIVPPPEREAAPTAPSQSPDRTAGVVPSEAAPIAEAPRDPARIEAGPDAVGNGIDGAPSAMPFPPEPAVRTDPAPAGPRPGDPVRLEPGSADSGAPIAFCFPDVIPLPGACADRGAVLALAGETIGVRADDGALSALSVELADPAGIQDARTAETCAQYLSLKANGWGPMTTAQMRRERQMNRFCGLVVMAERAAPGRGGLTALSEELLESMPDAQWPAIGEAEVANPIVLDTPGDPRVWFVQADRVEFTVRDVASADFDADGLNEVLVFTAVQAAGGTAVGGGYALAERTGGTLRLAPVDLY